MRKRKLDERKTKVFVVKLFIAMFILIFARDFIQEIPNAVDGTKYQQLIAEGAIPGKLLAYFIGVSMVIYGVLLAWAVFFVIQIVRAFIKAVQEEYGEA